MSAFLYIRRIPPISSFLQSNSITYRRLGLKNAQGLNRALHCRYVLSSSKYSSAVTADLDFNGPLTKSKRSYSSSSNGDSGFAKYAVSVAIAGIVVAGMVYFRERIFGVTRGSDLKSSGNSKPVAKSASKTVFDQSSKPDSKLLKDLDDVSSAQSLNKPELAQEAPKTSDKVDVEEGNGKFSTMDREEDEEVLPVYINPEARKFPTHVPYLIVGAGASGFAAARSIRAADQFSKILMINADCTTECSHILKSSEDAVDKSRMHPPYLRPPLSKELWNRTCDSEAKLLRSDGDVRRHSWLYYEADSFFLDPEELDTVQYGGVAMLSNDPVVKLDPDNHVVTLASGQKITYDCCLLSTGGKPRRSKHMEICSQTGTNLAESGHVSYFRNLADYKNLRQLVDKYRQDGGRIAVIGGGYLGSELAVSLMTLPKASDSIETPLESSNIASKFSVIHAFRETVPMGSILPPCLASAVGRVESSKGVELLAASEVVGLSLVPADDDDAQCSKRIHMRVRCNDSGVERVQLVTVDHVVCAIGIEPNTDLATDASLEIDPINGGFLVNAELEARQGVYASGDAASYWDPTLGCRRRVEHLNFAEETGLLAGRNMAAHRLGSSPANSAIHSKHYNHQSYLWSSLGSKVAWDAIGSVDSKRLDTRSFFAKDDGAALSSGAIPDSDLGRMKKGVVFYLTPKERRLSGILLWNLDDPMYKDDDFPAPTRLNLARNMLAQKPMIGRDEQTGLWTLAKETDDLNKLCRDFDLYADIEVYYNEVKAFFDSKKMEDVKVDGEKLSNQDV